MTNRDLGSTLGDIPRPIRAVLAKNVRRERVGVGLSQEELAERCHVRRSTVARIEKAVQEPRLSTLVAFSEAMGIPLAALMEGLLDPLPSDGCAGAPGTAK
jgi:transcriptional regulator with XRE-family HTH domain